MNEFRRFSNLAEVARDGAGEFAGRAAALAAHHLPEHRMVGVAAGVALNGGAHALRNAVEVGQDVLERPARPASAGAVERLIEVVDVSGVVRVVVQPHCLRVDDGLVPVVSVGKRGKRERRARAARHRPEAEHGRASGQHLAGCIHGHGSLLR